MRSKHRKGRPLCMTEVTDAIDHLLRPLLAANGGDAWLDEVLEQGFVIGFRAGAGNAPLVAEWIRCRLDELWPAYSAQLCLKDYTGRSV